MEAPGDGLLSRVITSMKNSSRGTYFIFQIVFYIIDNLREIPTVCGQTCLLFRGSSALAPCLHDHRWLDSDQQYHALCNCHYEEAIIVYFFAKPIVALQRQFIGQF